MDIKELWKHAIMELTLKVKNPYYLGNQQDQCNPYQNASDFSKTRKKNPRIHMTTTKKTKYA